ncbi:MAG: nucleoside deaminase [Candidatus Kapabacteria bacterium]|nr:nucleoside deaminase [Candidatus Kapabacteria bacterium]
MNTDFKFMSLALREAAKAANYGDVPVGCVVVCEGKIIGRGRNSIERKSDSLLHAELIAIQKAIKKNKYKHLLNCTIYVTLEPCAMCSGAIVLARIPRLVIAANDPKTGASGSLYSITEDARLNHRCEVVRGVMADESSLLLKGFFKKLRIRNS